MYLHVDPTPTLPTTFNERSCFVVVKINTSSQDGGGVFDLPVDLKGFRVTSGTLEEPALLIEPMTGVFVLKATIRPHSIFSPFFI